MDCEICHGSRWKSVTVDGVERLMRCDCWRGAVVEKLLKDARVPTRYARCELATFEHDMNTQREAWRRATRFVEAFPAVDKGLLLYGPHGVGKTHLAVGILKEVIRTKGARGFFFETRELLRLVRETYNRGTKKPKWTSSRPCSTPICWCSTTWVRKKLPNGCRKRSASSSIRAITRAARRSSRVT